jgi:hypothetical protein
MDNGVLIPAARMPVKRSKIMMNRRQFCTSIAQVSALMIIPVIPLPNLDEAVLHVSPKIRDLENYLRTHPGEFSWYTHNELRHEYLAYSEKVSRKHADILLANSIMDDYILNTLSDWGVVDGRIDHAIQTLTDNANHYHYLPHLRAACLIKAGNIYRENGMQPAANLFYEKVANSEAFSLFSPETMKRYYMLVRALIAE